MLSRTTLNRISSSRRSALFAIAMLAVAAFYEAKVYSDNCIPESDAEFCARLGKNCGLVIGTDNCGQTRLVPSCGECTPPATCGPDSVCTGGCTETDAAFCARLGRNCGTVTGIDACGNPRTVQSCGECTPPATCRSDGLCSCTPGQVCDPASGPCENSSICADDGACPPKTFIAAGTVCRPAAGECDLSASCTGASADCPPNPFKPAGTDCGTGVCDACNGTSATCVAGGTSCYTKQFFFTDSLGSVVAITDGVTHSVVCQQDYKPFGDDQSSSGNCGHLKFNGRVADEQSGLYYYGARYYDPLSARFISADTHAGSTQNLQWQNRYAYVLNNPYKFVDPTGHAPQDPPSQWGKWEYSAGGILHQVVPYGHSPFFTPPPPSEGEPIDLSPPAWLRTGVEIAITLWPLARGVPTLISAISAGERVSIRGIFFLHPEQSRGIFFAAEDAAQSGRLVIGRGADLAKPGALGPSEFKLEWPSKMPDWQAEWKTNSGLLRQEMRNLRPIRDASPGDTAGSFLNAERNLLQSRGWSFDPKTNLWRPPGR